MRGWGQKPSCTTTSLEGFPLQITEYAQFEFRIKDHKGWSLGGLAASQLASALERTELAPSLSYSQTLSQSWR
jgi:hypothetical protein